MLPKIGILYIPGNEFQECLEKFSALGTITAIIDVPHTVDLLVIPDSNAFNFLSPKVRPFRRHFNSSATISNYVDNFVTHLWENYYLGTRLVAFGASALTLHMVNNNVLTEGSTIFFLDKGFKREAIITEDRYLTTKTLDDEYQKVVKWFGDEPPLTPKTVSFPLLQF